MNTVAVFDDFSFGLVSEHEVVDSKTSLTIGLGHEDRIQ